MTLQTQRMSGYQLTCLVLNFHLLLQQASCLVPVKCCGQARVISINCTVQKKIMKSCRSCDLSLGMNELPMTMTERGNIT